MTQFKDDELIEGRDKGDTLHQGLNALCVYALLQSGRAIADPRLSVQGPTMQRLIQVMKMHSMISDPGVPNPPVTYSRSLRAAALAVYNRPEDRQALKEDVRWLLEASSDGAYTYDDRFAQSEASGLVPAADEAAPTTLPAVPRRGQPPPGVRLPLAGAPIKGPPMAPPPKRYTFETRIWRVPVRPRFLITQAHNGETPMPGAKPGAMPPMRTAPQGYQPPPYPEPMPLPWDNSNSQYGLLGVWSGAELGVEIPSGYWGEVQEHWSSHQLPNGQWYYSATQRAPTLTMTCGGLSSLLVTHDYLEAPMLGTRVARPPFSPALAKGMAWLEQGDSSINIMTPGTLYMGYTLYGLERVGLASGFKYFGTHDWYRELAAKVVGLQHPNGSWGRKDAGKDTLIDTAYALLFLARGRHPVLMNKLRFDGFWANRPRDVANLARFAGRELERPLNWQVVNLQGDWWDWTDSPILYLASHQPPKLGDEDYRKIRQFVEGGGMLFTQADENSEFFSRFALQLAQKLFPAHEMEDLPADHDIYTLMYKIAFPRPKLRVVRNGSRILMVHSPTDLSASWQQRAEETKRPAFELGMNLFVYACGKAELRNRLASTYIAAPTAPARGTVQLARLKYPANWDPEPWAWERFARAFQRDTGTALHVAPAEWRDLSVQTAPIAHLTGTAAYTPTEAELRSLRRYVEEGGILLIDICGGAFQFNDAVEKTILPGAFPAAKVEPIPPEHPLLKGDIAGAADLTRLRLRPYASQRLGQIPQRFKILKHGKGTVIFSSLDLTSGLLGTNTWGILGYDPAYAEAFVKNVILWSTEQPEVP